MKTTKTWRQQYIKKEASVDVKAEIADLRAALAAAPAPEITTETGLPELRDILRASATSGAPVTLSHLSACALFLATIKRAGQHGEAAPAQSEAPALPVLTLGSVYQSSRYGSATYDGDDVYFGQFTHRFKTAYGTKYILPEKLSEHFAPAAAQQDALQRAAQDVVDRWDSPAWKEAAHTGEFINRLRAAIAAMKGQ